MGIFDIFSNAVDKAWDFFVDGGVAGKTVGYDHKKHNGKAFGFDDLKSITKDASDCAKNFNDASKSFSDGMRNLSIGNNDWENV